MKKIIDWAVKQQAAGGSAKSILFVLAFRLNAKYGLCCRSIREIARDSGFSKSTVLRALGKLEAARLISIQRRRGVGHERLKNIYRLPAYGTSAGNGHRPAGCWPGPSWGASSGSAVGRLERRQPATIRHRHDRARL